MAFHNIYARGTLQCSCICGRSRYVVGLDHNLHMSMIKHEKTAKFRDEGGTYIGLHKLTPWETCCDLLEHGIALATRSALCPHLFCRPSSCQFLSHSKGFPSQNTRGGRPDRFSTFYSLMKTLHLTSTKWLTIETESQ